MKIAVLVFAAFSLCGSALADTFPALYAVTGVAAEDVLNIRSAPNSGSSKVGFLAPDQKHIEVVELDGAAKWGLISHGEGAGWVAMRFMRRIDQSAWHSLNQPLSCSGTEPFWSLGFEPTQNKVTFDSLGGSLERFEMLAGAVPQGRPPSTLGMRATSQNALMFATYHQAACSDGMSDRAYGLSVDLFIQQPEGLVGYSGCCSLRAP